MKDVENMELIEILTSKLEALIPDAYLSRLRHGIDLTEDSVPHDLRLLYKWRNGQIDEAWDDVILPFHFLGYEEAVTMSFDYSGFIPELGGEGVFLLGLSYQRGLIICAENKLSKLFIGNLHWDDYTVSALHGDVESMLMTWIALWENGGSDSVWAQRFSPESGMNFPSILQWRRFYCERTGDDDDDKDMR